MKSVLILCTGNSCRSQMAEGLWNHLGKDAWQAFSAGSDPAGYVHESAIGAMHEQGLDIASNRSKNVNEFLEQPIDLVVTVCDNAKDSCPTLPGATTVLHWPFEDPAHATGSDEEKMEMFRRVRDQISDRIASYLNEVDAS
ncbi:MAG: arsenate reductase ArsC [Pirellulaceae bacterium]|nr:arsenate reductase ArsC [Pirellulaceae bacterium]